MGLPPTPVDPPLHDPFPGQPRPGDPTNPGDPAPPPFGDPGLPPAGDPAPDIPGQDFPVTDVPGDRPAPVPEDLPRDGGIGEGDITPLPVEAPEGDLDPWGGPLPGEIARDIVDPDVITPDGTGSDPDNINPM